MFGILFFTSKSRVNGYGIPFIDFRTNKSYTVTSKKPYHIDMWAKVSTTSELIELIGPTCDRQTEWLVLYQSFGLNYKYPSFVFTPQLNHTPIFHAYTVDDISTLDRDDAISVTISDHITIGIHIIDIVKQFGETYMECLKWSQERVSSAYFETSSKPIFKNDTISLTKNNTYPCLSLFLTYNHQYQLIDSVFKPCDVYISDNKTYNEFSETNDAKLLSTFSNTTQSEDIIAWCMIQYNLYVAKNIKGVLLRSQEDTHAANYSYQGIHAAFGDVYTHATSPIRRFVDFYNQCVYYKLSYDLTQQEIDKINDRMNEIKEFHHRESIMSLAYKFKEKPQVVEALVVKNENERYIRLNILKKVFSIPLNDCFYAEPICDFLKEGETYQIECFGIHKNGRATLHIRVKL